jgi:hypothetical protein
MADDIPVAWPASVIDKHVLNVSYTKTLAAGGWFVALDAAIAFLNDYLKQRKVALTYVKTGEGTDGHVVFDTTPGNGVHGKAELNIGGSGDREYLKQITIRLPATPRISATDPKARVVGDGIKTCILVHEMIHGLGLPNKKHTAADVFSGEFQLLPGTSPAADKMQRDARSQAMPPPFINGETLLKIKAMWPAEIT